MGVVKQLGCEADCSPPSSAEVKNTWICTSTPPYVFMVWYFISQHRDNFTFSYMGVILGHSLKKDDEEVCHFRVEYFDLRSMK
jgi:hypothetical protein